MEAAIPEWKSEAKSREEIKKKKILKDNWVAFTSLFKQVEITCNSANVIHDYTRDYHNVNNDLDIVYRHYKPDQQPGSKRPAVRGESTVSRSMKRQRIVGVTITSTPVQWRVRKEKESSSVNLEESFSPIKNKIDSIDEVDPSIFSVNGEDESSKENDGRGKTNLSLKLEQFFSSPKNDRESQELIQVLQQTLELTKAALEKGIIRGCRSDPELVLNLSRNALYKPVRRIQSALFTEMMRGLNIDEWSGRDLTCPEMGGGAEGKTGFHTGF